MKFVFKGGIAQLGERLVCNQGVSGSNPLTSTKREREKQKVKKGGVEEKILLLTFLFHS